MPASTQWTRGPWEARFHSSAAPFNATDEPLRAHVSQPETNARAQLHHFSVIVPEDAPASRCWDDAKRGAFVDIRYRIAVAAQLSSGDILMAECVFLVSDPPNAPSIPHAPVAPRPTLPRSPGARSRRSAQIELSMDTHEWALDTPSSCTVRIHGVCGARIHVELVERVSYAGRLRSERVIRAERAPDDTWPLRASGFAPDTALGPLLVTHEVRARAERRARGVLTTRTPITLTRPTRPADTKTRAATRSLRAQPPIAYYWGDELPLFANLQYAAAAPPSIVPCASAVAARLPRLTPLAAADGEVCMLCLSALEDDTVTRLSPCAHVLHLKCAADWLRHVAAERRPSVACPMCKQDLQ